MMSYDGYPAKAPPAYDMAVLPTAPRLMYPEPNPTPAPGHKYTSLNPTPAPGHMYPEPNPTPVPGHMYTALNPTPAPSPALPGQLNMNLPLGPEPSRVTCPSCAATVVTRVQLESTTRTHLTALVLCFFLCWCCVCLPYCLDSCRNADHYCPNCDAFLGSYAK